MNMASTPTLLLADYQYSLPEDRIARYPLTDRDLSKLLVWEKGKISHSEFRQLCDFLPLNSALFFNNTKVIPARILFEKPTGGLIEVFLLSPADPEVPIAEALNSKGTARWNCAIGNARRWPQSTAMTKQTAAGQLVAHWDDRSSQIVTFRWRPSELPFATMVESAGAVPLPPYLKREAEDLDRERYQTVYSKQEGAVAAPTAGLHFTPALMTQLAERGVQTDFLTLHVSAGTFLPIKVDNAAEHRMHEEEIIVYKHNIINLLKLDRKVIAVGTTAMRTLESLYWYGVLLTRNPASIFRVNQDLPYELAGNVSTREALGAILAKMESEKFDMIAGHTSIFIRPGYQFRVVQGLITNFHQPGSSLLLLVSAFVGDDWKSIYNSALEGGYRFLSYGDSSLLIP